MDYFSILSQSNSADPGKKKTLVTTIYSNAYLTLYGVLGTRPVVARRPCQSTTQSETSGEGIWAARDKVCLSFETCPQLWRVITLAMH